MEWITRSCLCVSWLMYDFILGRDLPSSPCFSALVIVTLSVTSPYPTSRCAAASAIRILCRSSTGSYPRYARKLLRNVVLGRKFVAVVIEPPYRAQLSTVNPGLLRYTFESDFPWMSSAVAVSLRYSHVAYLCSDKSRIELAKERYRNDTT